jgi:hypothetical protein
MYTLRERMNIAAMTMTRGRWIKWYVIVAKVSAMELWRGIVNGGEGDVGEVKAKVGMFCDLCK